MLEWEQNTLLQTLLVCPWVALLQAHKTLTKVFCSLNQISLLKKVGNLHFYFEKVYSTEAGFVAVHLG